MTWDESRDVSITRNLIFSFSFSSLLIIRASLSLFRGLLTMLATRRPSSLSWSPCRSIQVEYPPSGPSRSSHPLVVHPSAGATSQQTDPITALSPFSKPGQPKSRTERRFCCTHTGCDKAYLKPSRLAEHKLTHTGEVIPFRFSSPSQVDEDTFRDRIDAHLATKRIFVLRICMLISGLIYLRMPRGLSAPGKHVGRGFGQRRI